MTDQALFLDGDRRKLAKALSAVENGEPRAASLLEQATIRAGTALRLGVTGPPGTGKSTLVGALASVLAERGMSVAVLAVDPTSPVTGGAVLGDRVRMQGASVSDQVFIRSTAARGGDGALASRTADMCDVLDAFGFSVLLLETVGAGQGDVAVADLVDATVLVLAPGAGDDVQAMKAGIMETAKIIVVNKADLPGASQLAALLRATLDLATDGAGSAPSVLEAVARDGSGVAELWEAASARMGESRTAHPASGHRAARLARRLEQRVEECVLGSLWTPARRARVRDLAARVLAGEQTLDSAAENVVQQWREGAGDGSVSEQGERQ